MEEAETKLQEAEEELKKAEAETSKNADIYTQHVTAFKVNDASHDLKRARNAYVELICNIIVDMLEKINEKLGTEEEKAKVVTAKKKINNFKEIENLSLGHESKKEKLIKYNFPRLLEGIQITDEKIKGELTRMLERLNVINKKELEKL